jgi:hypothetical protein
MLTPQTLYHFHGVGLDPSWNIGISLAVSHNLTFGQDFIFTFGPLGYLKSRPPLTVSQTTYLVWDAFVLANSIFILAYIYRHLRSYLSILLVFLTILVYSRAWLAIHYQLFLMFMFMLFYHLENRSWVNLGLASLLCLVLFYLQVGLGLAALVLMLVFLAYLLVFPRRYGRTVILLYSIAFIIALYLSALMLNTNIAGYVQGSYHLASAYNDAMYISIERNPYGPSYLKVVLAIFCLLGLVFLLGFKHLIQEKDGLLRYAFASAFIFLLFKHSFVRADRHILFFFQHISIAIGLLCLFSTRAVNRYLVWVLIVSLILSIPYATDLYGPQQWIATAKSITVSELVEAPWAHIRDRYHGFKHYLASIGDSELASRRSPQLEEVQLPSEIIQIIGNGTVDVVPWEISYIYANNLTYNPRPVIQSYTAYDDFLDSKNYEKYMSASAPDFILFLTDEIDGRHPFFNEPKTRLAILTQYEVVKRFDEVMLLRKRERPLEISTSKLSGMAANLGEYIELEETAALQYLSANIEYSLLGGLVRFIFQPPPLEVTVQFQDGEERTYRAVKTIVNGGVLVNKFVDSLDLAEAYFSSVGQAGKPVAKIKFHTSRPWGFEPEFTYRLKSITVESGAE